VIGSLEFGAVNVTVADPLLYARPEPASVAVPIVGATGTDLAPEALDPKIGIGLSYPAIVVVSI
jgi:hypothetical protein